METQEIALDTIDISEFNTRKDLADGQEDSTIEDLAGSISRQGLLSPITVYRRPNGRYGLVVGQRRLLACKRLGVATIAAIVRDTLDSAAAITISLVENVHRADMNPRDKAHAFRTLLGRLGAVSKVSRETGVGEGTIRKYLALLDLAPDLQQQLAAGEVRSTQALASLARRFSDPDQQTEVWGKIGAFTQDVQQEIIRRVDPDLSNLDDLKDQAAEGQLGYQIVRNCPYDCSTIPSPLKAQVASMIESFKA